MHAVCRLLPHPAAPVQHPVDGRRPQPGLKRDILDKKAMRHAFDAFLMDFTAR